MEEEIIRKVMPHSPDAEEAVIGAMFLDQEAIRAAADTLQAEDFYRKAYGALFSAMVSLPSIV